VPGAAGMAGCAGTAQSGVPGGADLAGFPAGAPGAAGAPGTPAGVAGAAPGWVDVTQSGAPAGAGFPGLAGAAPGVPGAPGAPGVPGAPGAPGAIFLLSSASSALMRCSIASNFLMTSSADAVDGAEPGGDAVCADEGCDEGGCDPEGCVAEGCDEDGCDEEGCDKGFCAAFGDEGCEPGVAAPGGVVAPGAGGFTPSCANAVPPPVTAVASRSAASLVRWLFARWLFGKYAPRSSAITGVPGPTSRATIPERSIDNGPRSLRVLKPPISPVPASFSAGTPRPNARRSRVRGIDQTWGKLNTVTSRIDLKAPEYQGFLLF
jgi:hypothetical protein